MQIPLAIVLEDTPGHALLARRHLEAVGFEVHLYDRLQSMLEMVRSELSPEQSARPVLVLADCKDIVPERPEIEGTAALAYLADEMSRGVLRSALLVAISSDPTDDRYAEAAAAGCAFFLEKPIDRGKAGTLFQMTLLHPAESQLELSGPRRAFHAIARRSITALTTPPVWTNADAYALLATVTSFRLQDRAQPDGQPRASTESLIAQLGGAAGARERLRAVAATLEHPYNKILLSYLDGDWSNDTRAATLQMQRSTFHYYRKFLPDVIARALTG